MKPNENFANKRNVVEQKGENLKTYLRIKDDFAFGFGSAPPTVCVTCVWAGWDSVREQEKLEARKMLENAAESHTSGARCVGTLLFYTTPSTVFTSL